MTLFLGHLKFGLEKNEVKHNQNEITSSNNGNFHFFLSLILSQTFKIKFEAHNYDHG